MNERLATTLRRLGLIGLAAEHPTSAWLALYEAIGERATLIDRYEIEAAARGLSVTELSSADRTRLRSEVLPVLFPGWQEAKMPTQPDPIFVVDYDPQWPRQFAELKRCLQKALAGLATVVEHVGSTAVPGMAAKPVIDVMVAVPDSDDESAYVSGVEQCGVALRSKDDGHRYFRPSPPQPRDKQIHVVDIGSDWQRRHLLFRDYLRAHPDVAADYGELKRQLALTYRDDRLAYNAAKTHFILDAMEDAVRWSEHRRR